MTLTPERFAEIAGMHRGELVAEVRRLHAELDDARATALTLDRQLSEFRTVGWTVVDDQGQPNVDVETDGRLLWYGPDAASDAGGYARASRGERALPVYVRDGDA